MARHLKILCTAILILGFGCAQGVDMSSTATSSDGVSANGVKSLFSYWVDSSGLVAVDFRQAAFNTQKPMTITTANQQSCSCQVVVVGTEASGTVQLSSCSGNISNGSTTCASFNGNGTYTLNNNTLNLCQQATGCDTFN